MCANSCRSRCSLTSRTSPPSAPLRYMTMPPRSCSINWKPGPARSNRSVNRPIRPGTSAEARPRVRKNILNDNGHQLQGLPGDSGPSAVGAAAFAVRLVIVVLMKAVRFDHYGDIDVLEVREVERPVPGEGEVLVEVKAAGINPGEAKIRTGALRDVFPATFPSGQGSDLAGVVAEVGPGVHTFAVGDEVLGFSEKRSSQAQFVAVPAEQLTTKPKQLSWEVAGSLYVAGP